MKGHLIKAKLLIPLLFVLFLGSGPPQTAHASSGTSNGCVDWRAEAVFNGLGYNHLVHLTSRCDKAVHCAVSSDVNPEPTQVPLAPRQSKTVNTFLGSPAQKFTAKVTCLKK
jgi:hypothetical protein